MAGLLLAPSLASADGKALYDANCAKCHGATGMADTPVAKAMKVASLHDPKLAADDGASLVVKHVREDPKHKTLSDKLSDEDLAAIADFVHQLASGG